MTDPATVAAPSTAQPPASTKSDLLRVSELNLRAMICLATRVRNHPTDLTHAEVRRELSGCAVVGSAACAARFTYSGCEGHEDALPVTDVGFSDRRCGRTAVGEGHCRRRCRVQFHLPEQLKATSRRQRSSGRSILVDISHILARSVCLREWRRELVVVRRRVWSFCGSVLWPLPTLGRVPLSAAGAVLSSPLRCAPGPSLRLTPPA